MDAASDAAWPPTDSAADRADIQRVFLGWSRPAVPAIADWLVDRFGNDHDGVWVVVPTARSGRKLEQALADRLDAFAPPRIVTPGAFVDAWVRRVRSVQDDAPALADELDATLAWVSVLRAFAGADEGDRCRGDRSENSRPEDSRLAALVPDPPQPGDWAGWWSLASQVRRVRSELASGNATLADAAARASGSGPRWSVLTALDRAYEATLEQWNLADRETATGRALAEMNTEDAETAWSSPVVLAALADPTPRQSAIFTRCPDLTALVFADANQADRFEAIGGLVTDAWADTPVGVTAESLRVVEQQGDEPDAVAAAIVDAARDWEQKRGEPLRSSDVAIGLADETRGPAIVRGVRAAGGSARSGVGRPFRQTPPAVLLAAYARLLETERFDALAALVRHPDLERWLASDDALPDLDEPPRISWPGLLDAWASRTLRGDLLAEWLEASPGNVLGQPTQAEQIAAVYRAVRSLLPASQTANGWRLSEHSEAIRGLLRRVYADRNLIAERPADADTVQAITQLAAALDDQTRPREHTTTTADVDPAMSASQAIRWTLARCDIARTADPPDAGDIEATGLLDAAMDAAPVLVLASVNDGHFPGRPTEDAAALLTDSLRQSLGVPDARRRLARDAYLLHTMSHSREHLSLIAARRGDEGDPLKPSRLWVRGSDPQDTARRLLRFYDAPANDAFITGTKSAGETNRFIIPRPDTKVPLPDRLSVIAFRTYLACPYRFYLTHVLGLREATDRAMELDGAAFGSLLHDALAELHDGPTELQTTANPESIRGFLVDALHAHAAKQLGRNPRPAIQIQLAFAEERLAAFAKLQAQWNAEGWGIAASEHDAQAMLRVEAGEMLVRGRIDRIDTHPDGRVRVLDFKTGDVPKRPMQQHVVQRGDQRIWTDLQLPLYRDLIANDESLPSDHGGVSFGYVVLPRDPDATEWLPLEADPAFSPEAEQVRDAVLTGILTRQFKPSGQTPTYADPLAGVCGDGWPGRAADLVAWDEPAFIRGAQDD